MVDIEPGWQVLTACKKVMAFPPRISPRMIRTRRRRRDAINKSAVVTRAAPSTPKSVTKQTAFSWTSRSSGEFSMRTRR